MISKIVIKSIQEMFSINSFSEASNSLYIKNISNMSSKTENMNNSSNSRAFSIINSNFSRIQRLNKEFLKNKWKLGDLVDIPNYNDYLILCMVGTGAYGIVFKIYSEKKILDFSVSGFLTIKFDLIEFQEVKFHKSINTKYIVESGTTQITQHFKNLILPYFDDSKQISNIIGYMVMKTGDCDLHDLIKKKKDGEITKENIVFLLYSLVKEIHYYHERHIVHRDIKPKNILIIHNFAEEKIEYILCDFSQWIEVKTDKLLKQKIGTYGYIAPELIDEQDDDREYDPYKADIYSLGISSLEMLINEDIKIKIKKLMDDKKFNDILELISSLRIDDSLKQLFLRILTPDPIKRISIDDLFMEIKKFPGYNNSYQPNISDIILSIAQERSNSQLIVDIDKNQMFYKLFHTNDWKHIGWIVITSLSIKDGNINKINKLLNSNDDLELKFIGLIYFFGLGKSLPRNLSKTIEIFNKIIQKTQNDELKYFSQYFLKYIDKILNKNGYMHDLWVYDLSTFLSEILPNTSIYQIYGFINKTIFLNFGWIVQFITSIKQNSHSCIQRYLAMNKDCYKHLIEDLPILKLWRIKFHDIDSYLKYFACNTENFDIQYGMRERGVIIQIQNCDQLDKDLFKIHSRIENYIKINHESRLYFQEMYTGSKYFMIKHNKYTLKRYLALYKLFEFHITPKLVFQLLEDIINALFILKQLGIIIWFISPNMIQMKSEHNGGFGLCKFKYASIYEDRNNDLMLKPKINNKPYVAPELLDNNIERCNPWKACIYSLGCCMIQLLCESRIPLEDPEIKLEKFETNLFYKEIYNHIIRMIDKNPEKRIQIEDLYIFLKDEPQVQNLVKRNMQFNQSFY